MMVVMILKMVLIRQACLPLIQLFFGFVNSTNITTNIETAVLSSFDAYDGCDDGDDDKKSTMKMRLRRRFIEVHGRPSPVTFLPTAPANPYEVNLR